MDKNVITSSNGEILNDTPIGTGEVNPNTGLDFKERKINVEKINARRLGKEALYFGERTGEIHTGDVVPKSIYRILGDDYHPEFDPEYNAKLLSRNQTNAGKFVSALNQAVVGNMIGGTIEGLGYIGDIPMMIDLAEGTEQEFGNVFTRFGKSMNTWAEETTPVYTDPTAPKFNPTSWEWWMKNMPSVASTVSLVVPSMAGMKGVQAIGKLLEFSKGANETGVFSKLFSTSLGQAVMSRHMESLMEAQGTYDQGLTDTKQRLYSKYQSQIESEIKQLPIFTPINPELGPQPGQYTDAQYNADINKIKNKWDNVINSEAIKVASIGAANTYSKNWVMLLQDLPEYMLLNRFLKPGAKSIAASATENSAKVAERLGYNMPKFYASKTAKQLGNMIGEGFEENYQFLVGQQSADMIKNLDNPDAHSSLIDEVKANYDNGDLWTNTFFGAIGAGFMQATMAGINSKALSESNKARIKNINTWSTLMNKLHGDYVAAEEMQDEALKKTAVQNFVAATGLKSIELGNKEHLLNMVDALASDDQNALTNYEMATDTRNFLKGKTDIAKEIKDSIENLDKKYKDSMSEFTRLGVKEKDARALARSLSYSNHMLEYLNKESQEQKSKLKDIEIEGYNKPTPSGEILSDQGKQLFELRHNKEDLNRRIKYIDKQIESNKTSKEEKLSLEKQKNRLVDRISKIDALGKEINKDEARSAEQKAIDNKLIGNKKTPGIMPKSEVDTFIDAQKLVNSYEENIEYFKEQVAETREIANKLSNVKTKTEPINKPVPTEETDSDLNVGSVVTYEKDGKEVKGIVEEIDYADKDTEGNEQVPSAENIDNIISIRNDDGSIDHVSGATVHPVDKEVQETVDEGIAEDDVNDNEDILPPEDSTPGSTLKEQNRRKTNSVDKGLIEFLSYTQYEERDPNNPRKFRKLIVRNKELDDFISDPDNQQYLPTATASYEIDKKNKEFSDIIEKLSKSRSVPMQLIDAWKDFKDHNKPLSEDNVKRLAQYASFFGNVPVSVKITINGHTFPSKGLYLHTLEKTRKYIKDEAVYNKYVQLRQSITKHLLSGDKIYTVGLSTNRGNPNNIDNVNSLDARKNNVATTLKQDLNKMELFILKSSTKYSKAKSYSHPKLQKSVDSIENIPFDFSSVGSVFAKTDRTVNGQPFAVKLNKSFISSDHANLIFNAFAILAQTEMEKENGNRSKGLKSSKKGYIGYYNAAFHSVETDKIDPSTKKPIKEPEVWNLSVGEFLDLMIVHGQDLTDPDSNRYKQVNKLKAITQEHKNALKNKRVFLERGYDENGNVNSIYLCYGMTTPYSIPTSTKGEMKQVDYNRINLSVKLTTKESEAAHFKAVQGFRDWIMSNKTYAVHLENKMLGLTLNSGFLQGRSFRIGKTGMKFPLSTMENGVFHETKTEIIRNPGESYVSFLIKNNIVTTDLEEKDGKLFSTPFLHLGLNTNDKQDFGIKVGDTPKIKESTEIKVKRPRAIVKQNNDKVKEPNQEVPTSKDKKNRTESIIHDDDIILRERTTSTRKPYEKQDLLKELAWVRKRVNIDDDEVEIEKRLSNMMFNGKKAWATYSSAGITLFEGAETGTIYHEAFHRVSLGYFTKEERESFYRSARQLYKMPKEEFTDSQVEEKLAEEFRTYVITEQKSAQPNTIKRIFKGIYEFFKALFFGRNRLTHSDIDRLFNQIYSGRYRFSKIRSENLGVSTRLREVLGNEFDTIATYKDITTVTKYLAKQLLSSNNITNLNDVNSIKWEPLIHRLEKKIKDLNVRLEDGDITEIERNQNIKVSTLLRDVLGEPDKEGNYTKFESFKRYVNRFLGGIGIAAHEHEISHEEIYDTSDYYSELDDVESPHKIDSSYGKVDYATSLKDNALASVRFIINTLYESEEMDESTGLVGFANGNKVWSKLMNDIIEYDDVKEMISKIRQIGEEESYSPYTQLADILDKSSESFQTQFQSTFEAYKHDFIISTFKKKGDGTISMVFDSASHNELSRNTALRWNEFLMYDSNVVILESQTKGKSTIRTKKVNEEFFDNLIKEYEDKVKTWYNNKRTNEDVLLTEKELENLFVRISKILGKLHIDVSSNVLRRYAYTINKKRSLQDNLDKLISNVEELLGPDLLINNDGDFRNIISNGIVRSLSEVYAEVNIHEESEMTIGPEGNKFYKYGRLNIATDNIRRIKRSSVWAEEKVSRIYNRRSRALNSFVPKDDSAEAKLEAANNRNAFGLVTVSSFKSGVGGDKGREYLKLNNIEDYLFKAYAIMNADLLPLPVMANRKTYYMMKGLKTIGVHDDNGNTSSVIKSSTSDGQVVFTDEVINMYYDYYLDEKDRIDKAKKDRKSYEEEKKRLDAALKDPNSDKESILKKQKELKTRLIRNYHYLGEYNMDKGNAYHFIHFKGFEKYKTVGEVRNAINELLNDRLKDELKFASEQEIINKSFDKETNTLTLYPKLLDGLLVTNREDLEKPQNFGVLSTLATIMVNTSMSVIESEKLFLADPAFFKRNNAKGETNLDVFEDMYKRWFGVGSTGTRIRSKYPNRSTSYNVSILETQKFSSKVFEAMLPKHSDFYYDLLKSKLSEEQLKDKDTLIDIGKEALFLATSRLAKFKSVDPTDGMSLISPEMYKEIIDRMGLWDDKKQKAYDLLMSDKELTSAQIIKSSNVVFSPLKTMYIGTHNFNGIDLPIYNKTAMFTLFRQHVKNTFLEEVLDRMELKGKYEDKGLEKIDVYNFDSAIKVGSLASTKLFTDKNKRDKLTDLGESFVFKQSYDNLKHQQVVEPHDAMNQTFGTAGFKIATADIDKVKPYGEFATGMDLLNTITSARNALSNTGLHRIDSQFGISNGKISDKKLIETVRSAAEQAKKSFDFINALRTDPVTGEKYLELDAFNDRKWIYARIKSIVDSNTVDLNTPGTQLVQVTDYGMTNADYKEELSFIRSTQGDKRVFEMECRVSIRLFKKFFPKGYKITEKDIIELLDNNPNIFGYRVPTQGQNSLVKLKVVEFLPEQSGDIIQLPLEFTALTGSDFDIDKLYVSLYNYDTVKNKDGSMSLVKVPFSTSEAEAKDRYKNKTLELFDIYKDSAESFRDIMSIDENDKKVPIVSKYFMGYSKSLQELKDDATSIPNNPLDDSDADRQYINNRLTLREGITLLDLESLQAHFVATGKLLPYEQFKKLSTEEQNTEIANQNRLLDCIFTVLSDEKHFINTTTPLGAMTDILEEKAKKYNNIYDAGAMENVPALYTTIPSFQSKMKYKFNSSTFGIAPYALSNNHHSLTQMAEVVMTDTPNFGFNEKHEIRLDRVVGEDNMYITWWLSALIDAHVDGVNKPYITSLNVNEATHDIVNFLIRAGLGEPTFDFLNQPILKEYTFNYFKTPKSKQKKSYSISPISEEDPFKYTLSFWNEKLIDDGVFTEEELSTDNFTKYKIIPLAKLLNPIQLMADAKEYMNKTRSKEFYLRQLSIMYHFKDIKESAEQLRNFVLASRVDTKKYGSNPVEILHFLSSMYNVIDSDRFKNIERIITTDKNYQYKAGDTFLPTLVQNSMYKIFDILKQESIYASPGFNELLNNIVDSTASGDYNRMGMINTLMEELVTYFMGRFFADPDYGIGMDYQKLSQLIFEQKDSIYETINKLKSGTHPLSKEVIGNAFIDSIVVDFSTSLIKDKNDEGIPYTYLKALFRSLREDLEQDEIKDGFKALLNSPHEELRKLALNLYVYSFYTTGMRNKHYGFVSALPMIMNRELLIDNKIVSWNSYLKNIMGKLNTPNGWQEFITDAKRDVFTNLWDSRELTWEVDDTLIDQSFNNVDDEPTAIRVKLLPQTKKMFLGLNEYKEKVFSPYLNYANNQYEYVGYDKETGNLYYLVTAKKGFLTKGISLNEYGIKTAKGDNRSIIKVNNATSKRYTQKELIEQLISTFDKTEKLNFVAVPLENQLVKEVKRGLYDSFFTEDAADEMRQAEKEMNEEENLINKNNRLQRTAMSIQDQEEEDVIKTNEQLKASFENKTTYENPILIDVDGSAKGENGLGAGAYSKFGNKEYYMYRDESTILSYLTKVMKNRNMEVPSSVSNPTSELYALLSVLDAFKDTSEHVFVTQDYATLLYFWDNAVNPSEVNLTRPYTKEFVPKEPQIKVLQELIKIRIKQIEGNGGSVRIKYIPTKTTSSNRVADKIAKGIHKVNNNRNDFREEKWGKPTINTMSLIENKVNKKDVIDGKELDKNCK
jgi:hypothetical protein